jgi:hypothetical protein
MAVSQQISRRIRMSLQERAQSLFKNDLASEATVQHNVEAWLKAVTYLGEKWVCVVEEKRSKK